MSTQITQLINDRGNAVVNHFVIHRDGDRYLQSYNSIVAKIDNHYSPLQETLICLQPFKLVTLGSDWDYSRTTLKHLRTFLGDALGFVSSTAELRKAIKDGDIVIDNNLWRI